MGKTESDNLSQVPDYLGSFVEKIANVIEKCLK